MEKCPVWVSSFQRFWGWRLLTLSVCWMDLFPEMLSTQLAMAREETSIERARCSCFWVGSPGYWRGMIAVYLLVAGMTFVSRLLWDSLFRPREISPPLHGYLRIGRFPWAVMWEVEATRE